MRQTHGERVKIGRHECFRRIYVTSDGAMIEIVSPVGEFLTIRELSGEDVPEEIKKERQETRS
jgi:hypothetical protein